MARKGTLAATRRADAKVHAAWYAWQLALRDAPGTPQAAEAEQVYRAAVQVRADAATAMHAAPTPKLEA